MNDPFILMTFHTFEKNQFPNNKTASFSLIEIKTV